MLSVVWLGLFLPLFGFIILMSSSKFISRKFANILACGTVFFSFLSFVALTIYYLTNESDIFQITLYRWIHLEQIKADFSVLIDSLSLLMTLIITGIGFLIHVYSIGYMDHEEDYARYFAFMNFFIFAMLLLVLSSNLLLLFVGWEGVGIASYFLIGFWYYRVSAAQAATKAFVVNRIGDFGFLIGLLLTFYLFGTSEITEVNANANQFAGLTILSLLTSLFFWGATAKSAQIPLQVWLPDAMEGPTPVSALIHAATMVTAGVYLVVRLHSLFLLTPIVLNSIGYIGAATALYAAICAIGQTDLKRVLAYSTISQLGLMFLACGIGAFYPAMFHLTTHAFMKALLFLAAGNVVHMMNGATNMDRMGGLKDRLPKTQVLFLIGVLAMSGLPPFAAFFSKDLILEEEYITGHHYLFFIGLLVSILTAFYLTRAYYLTFRGSSRLDSKFFKDIHEAPSIMILPVAILAVFAIVGGFLGFNLNAPPILEDFLSESDVTLASEQMSHGFHITKETWFSILGALIGVTFAIFVYSRISFKNPPRFLKNGLYIDKVYSEIFVKPFKALSNGVVQISEPKIFDGSLKMISGITESISHFLQKMQSGLVRSYVAWMAIGMVFLIIYMIV